MGAMKPDALNMGANKDRTGFTLLEVMMALAVITIGASALIGMQTVIARANAQSRDVTTATDIAQTWAERLKLDAVSWTQANAFANTVWLRDSLVTMNAWTTPAAPGATPLRSFAFDRYGQDVAPADPNLYFCVAYRLSWVAPPTAFPDATQSMRADIRVYWPREGTTTAPVCVETAATNTASFHSVSLPVVVRRTLLVTLP